MDAKNLADYISQAQAAAVNAWEEQPLRQLSYRQVPADVLGPHAWLLEADAKITWTNWFVDGLIDRTPYVLNRNLRYAQLYVEIQKQLRDLYPSLPVDEIRMAASVLSDLAWDDISRRRNSARIKLSREEREELWFAAEPQPRCYLCGYMFADRARDRYLNRGTASRIEREDLPLLVDFTRPRGLLVRDVSIEVDHVAAVAGGGQSHPSNLKLSCGWCNRVKSDRTSLYAAPATFAGSMYVQGLGRISLPQPLWILRIVATRGRCEHPSGCTATLQSHELFVAPRNIDAMLNPVNCRVYCAEHDPWSTLRFVGRNSVLRLFVSVTVLLAVAAGRSGFWAHVSTAGAWAVRPQAEAAWCKESLA